MGAGPEEPAEAEVYVGRQPIVDARSVLYAYELLYRDGQAAVARFTDGAAATYHVVTRALLDVGFDQLVGDAVAFINANADFLAAGGYRLLPPGQTVVEILEDTEVTDEVARGAAEAVSMGYRLALDDYSGPSSHDRLGPLAAFVKVDVLLTGPERLAEVVAHTRAMAPRAKLLAEKVETEQDVRRCQALGFELFQGYFVGRPEQHAGRQVPASTLASLRLVAELQRPDLDVADLEETIGSDPVLSYRLLRMVNSAASSLRRGVTSVREAIVMTGLEGVRHLASVLVLTTASSSPSYLVDELVVRARMCQTMAEALRLPVADVSTAFTVGLFSGLDILLGVPMAQVLADLPLSGRVRAALLERSGPLGALVSSAVSYQRAELGEMGGLASLGDWREAFREAVAWSGRLRSGAPGLG